MTSAAIALLDEWEAANDDVRAAALKAAVIAAGDQWHKHTPPHVYTIQYAEIEASGTTPTDAARAWFETARAMADAQIAA